MGVEADSPVKIKASGERESNFREAHVVCVLREELACVLVERVPVVAFAVRH